MPTRIIAYYRVSTKRQGESGLGLEGQQTAVKEYAIRHGAAILAAYQEIESGKRSDRPKLLAAIAHAKRSKAQLVVAKLDRLARNVHFLSSVMESGVDFVAVDNPTANRLTVHILAAVAEAEAKSISERTTTALAAAKRRGIKLGAARPGFWTPERHQRRLVGLSKATKRSVAIRREQARTAYADLAASMKDRRDAGASLQAIADGLNAEGHTLRNGQPWSRQAVRIILKRFA
ncbi:MAG TPA: recombinase family protein [Planctomycetaceae bacterium]|jgi:DNA invertase Pin-like site-specific DNA recombinase|nr:recombinase family protein [Planctomycetaceae bacterium]